MEVVQIVTQIIIGKLVQRFGPGEIHMAYMNEKMCISPGCSSPSALVTPPSFAEGWRALVAEKEGKEGTRPAFFPGGAPLEGGS